MSYHVLRACVFMTACVLVINAVAIESNTPTHPFLKLINSDFQEVVETDPTYEDAPRKALTDAQYFNFETRLANLIDWVTKTTDKFNTIKADPEVQRAVAQLAEIQERNVKYGKDFWAEGDESVNGDQDITVE